ncbi:MAG: GNAT family N-acetyltransferase [Bacteroidetes bacterium]|nr:GNAT family N-acetyltransferase [Bacteroidota bacterium]
MFRKEIRFRTAPTGQDIENIREIVTSTGFFYDFEIPVAVELVEDRLKDGLDSGYYFLFADDGERTVAYSCFGPIACTEGSYDLFWIVTHNDYRGAGIGKKLLEATEEEVKKLGGRMLIAETSTLPKYTPTRHFYESNQYKLEADIPDFYKPGDGKAIYIKRFPG